MTQTINTPDGHELAVWRRANGVSLAEVSALTGYSVAHISRVERGERKLSALAKIQVARALDVPLRELFPPGREMAS